MSNLNDRLDSAENKIKEPKFRENRGLGNEVGYYIFDYPAEDELYVRERINYIQKRNENSGDEYKIVIPLIDVRTEKGHKETTSAVISLVSLSNKITNLIFSLDFIQNEPVGSVVKETTYRICFVNENGEKISNEIIHTADNKSTEAANRIFKLRFNLRNRPYNRSDKYYLLIVDDKKDLEVLRQEVMIDIAFADDFGF